jgi:hypothetical protein
VRAALARALATTALAAWLATSVAPGCDRAPAKDPPGPEPASRGTAGEEASSEWPAGTVLVVGGEPITADEVDVPSVYMQHIQPSATGPQLRRLALHNVTLPRAIARVLHREEHAAAKRDADHAYARLVGKVTDVGPGLDPAEGATTASGTWNTLGFVTWGTALDLPEGQWSEPIEDVGYWVVMRRLGKRDGPVTLATEVTIEAFRFPWMPEETRGALIEAAYDRLRLEFVDPAWREFVPESTQYRMGARQP